MSSDKNFVEFILDQIKNAGAVSARPMFGEYGVYCDGKIVALIFDDQLFVKPTEAGKKFIGDPLEAPPYPGAKNYFLIEDKLEDREWIAALIKATARELPLKKAAVKTAKKKVAKKAVKKGAAKKSHIR